MKAIFIAASLFSSAVPVLGQVKQDADAYCAYIEEQAQAQKTLYRSPNLEAGVSQPNQAIPAETFVGVDESLSNFRKSQLVAPVAKDNCQLYRATIDAQEHIAYALPKIERDVLRKRVTLTAQAVDELNTLILQNQKKVEARDATLPSLYMLQSAKAKFDADRVQAELTLSTMSIPALSSEPLKNLAGAKQNLELATQEATAKLNKQINWDVTLMAGIRHDASPFLTAAPGAYGGFDAKWNIGSWKRNKELEQSAADYVEWKRQQDDDAIRGMAQLRGQIESIIAAQELALAAMQSNEDLIRGSREKIKGVDTEDAILFDNQLVVDDLNLCVEIGVTQFRIANLKRYLADNF